MPDSQSARFLEEIHDVGAVGGAVATRCRVCGSRSPAPELWGDPGPRPIPHGPNCPVAIIAELEGRLVDLAPPKLTAEGLAQLFHENYEYLAPGHGYETRRDSAVPWTEVPEKNRALMVAVAAAVLEKIRG
jgi:hypothetical protein